MNERLKQLAEQAGFHSSAILDLGTGTGVEVWHKYDIENDHEHFPTDEMMTKFAELIVQSCLTQIALIGISNLENDEHDDISWTVNTSIDMIRDHFGVEK